MSLWNFVGVKFNCCIIEKKTYENVKNNIRVGGGATSLSEHLINIHSQLSDHRNLLFRKFEI